jgi:periplasmic protein TonB
MLIFFRTMAFVFVLRKSVFVILTLAIWTAAARSQATAPNPTAAHSHVQLEAKPPDEPSPSSTPDVEAVPDAAPSTGAMPAPAGSDDDSDAPIAANAVAHPPEIVTYVVPEYPPKARARGIEGRVLLMVIVDESGKVEDNVQVVDSIPMLDQAAIDAVRQWSFTPGRDVDGDPVRVQLEVPVRFTLR